MHIVKLLWYTPLQVVSPILRRCFSTTSFSLRSSVNLLMGTVFSGPRTGLYVRSSVSLANGRRCLFYRTVRYAHVYLCRWGFQSDVFLALSSSGELNLQCVILNTFKHVHEHGVSCTSSRLPAVGMLPSPQSVRVETALFSAILRDLLLYKSRGWIWRYEWRFCLWISLPNQDKTERACQCACLRNSCNCICRHCHNQLGAQK